MMRRKARGFLLGGSERSGQQIVGPPKKKSSNEVLESLSKGAREHRAVPLDHSGKEPGASSKTKAFTGGGYRLGAAPEESTYVAGERQAPNSQQDVHVVLKLWKTVSVCIMVTSETTMTSPMPTFLRQSEEGRFPLS